MTKDIEEQEDYGEVTLGYGSLEQRKSKIKSFLQAEYKDHRLITVCNFEDAFGLIIENPQSTGRSNQNMHLSKESLVALLSTAIMYLEMSGMDMQELIKQSTNGDNVQFSYSKDLQVDKIKSKNK
jgi:hypothetical protein